MRMTRAASCALLDTSRQVRTAVEFSMRYVISHQQTTSRALNVIGKFVPEENESSWVQLDTILDFLSFSILSNEN